MKLSVKERLLLLNILPKESNFLTLRIVRDLQNALSFSEEEVKQFEFKTEGNKAIWNQEKEIDKEIQIGEKATDLIIDSLKELDKLKKINMDIYNLYEKFVS